MPQTPRTIPADLVEVGTRAEEVRQIIARFPVIPVPTGLWHQVDDVLSDVPALTAEVASLRGRLTACRMDRVNLAAAARIAVAAYRSGESDPLAFLLDELHAQDFGSERGTYG